MIAKDVLNSIVKDQEKALHVELVLPREQAVNIKPTGTLAFIIAGIRRCGKSTLMRELLRKRKNACFFNFEDPRATGFELVDFERLIEILGESNTYFFDEIQTIIGWEKYVRYLLDKGKTCVITGSNALLLSRELGTKLTGRHITTELFPFSFSEYCSFTHQALSLISFQSYLSQGGFPEFLKQNDIGLLQDLFKDILLRDIAVRHGVRDTQSLSALATFLLSNVGKPISYLKLAKNFGFGSSNTVAEYISFMLDSYLFFLVPKFSASLRQQAVNPKKVYCIDTGLIRANTASLSHDTGRLLENLVFLHLRKKYKEVFYFQNGNECDFVVPREGLAVQVCTELTSENQDRELEGLRSALGALHSKKGVVVTLRQEDVFQSIRIIPVWKWLLEKK